MMRAGVEKARLEDEEIVRKKQVRAK